MAHTPTAAPVASMSGILWPMMNSLEESDTRADRAFAITRLFTFVALLRLGGVASIKLKGELVADDRLVSPRERAISMDRLAYCISSWKLPPSLPMPMDRVAARRWN